MKKAVVSVTNDLYTDQRVARTCNLLHSMGYEVLLVGRKKKNSLPMPKRLYRTHRFKLLFEKGFLFYASYNIYLFFFLLFRKTGLLVANDLDTLLPNYLVHKIKRIPLVYDSHEYFTGVPEIQNKAVVKKVWQTIEKFCFSGLSDIFTVNNSIASLYEAEYGKKIHVVRNLSASPQIERLKTRQELNMPIDKSIVLLQGAGINMDRGVEEALLAMQPKYGLENVVFYIIGDGDAVSTLKKKTAELNLKERVVFLPKQDYKMLYHYTANADIGLTLDKDTNINYRYSLPNKLFDYIHAQIPVLASPLIEVKSIVEKYRIGLLIENHSPSHIAQKINTMLHDEKMREVWQKKLKIASENLNWETEQKKMENVFRKYL